MTKAQLEDQVNDLEIRNAQLEWKVTSLNAVGIVRLSKEEHQELVDKINEHERTISSLDWRNRKLSDGINEEKEKTNGLTNLLIKLTNNIHL